jgi:hypothetical protein
MPSDLTPRERALMALYGSRPPDIVKGGAVTEAIESAIVAAVAEERERCASRLELRAKLFRIERLALFNGALVAEELTAQAAKIRNEVAEADPRMADTRAQQDRDAARYRWLRNHQHCIPIYDLSTCSRELAAKTLDAFLDAEISAEPA